MMDHECYNQGSCKVCGCTTTNLQMTNHSCGGVCYPQIVDAAKWKEFKNHGVIHDPENKVIWKNRLKIDRQFNTACKEFIVRYNDYVG